MQATCISVEGAAYLEETNELPSKYIRSREVVSQPTARMLTARMPKKRDSLFELVEANLLREKTSFLLAVVNQWIQGGGLGCAVKDWATVRWEGAQLEGSMRKSDPPWITVGRHGGDQISLE